MKEITYRCDLCKDVIERGVGIFWETRGSASMQLSPDRAVSRVLSDRECECHVCDSCLVDLRDISNRRTQS